MEQTLDPLRISESEYLRDSKRYFEEAKRRLVVISSDDGRSRVTLTRPQAPMDD